MGTSEPSDPNSPLVPQQFDELIRFVPALQPEGYFNSYDIQFTFSSIDDPIDSSQITTRHWQHIAEAIQNNYEDHDGFVILHGTDTMAYTASMLSFMLEGLQKPVVLTGSQLPIAYPRSDGYGNLINSIFIAAAEQFNIPLIPEVMICFNDDLFRGNRSTKVSTFDLEGFASPNCDNLGQLEEAIRINEREIFRQTEPFSVKTQVAERVINVGLFPGFQPDLLCDLLDRTDVRGIVLRSFGSGNVPHTENFKRFLEKAHQQEIAVLNITQCVEGSVNQGKYGSSLILNEFGVIDGGDLTPEAAITKLMWCLENAEKASVRSHLRQNLRGEITTAIY
jgi:L-asparaginase